MSLEKEIKSLPPQDILGSKNKMAKELSAAVQRLFSPPERPGEIVPTLNARRYENKIIVLIVKCTF